MSSFGSAVVLGSAPIAEILSTQLKGVGFDAQIEETRDGTSRLPKLSDEQAIIETRLRDFLASVANQEAKTLIHPGVSVWADRPELATLAQEYAVTLVSPPSRVLSLFGNRLSLFQAAEAVGIPNLATGLDPVRSVREVERIFEQEKFPIILRSVRGPSGSGITVIHGREDLEQKLPLLFEQVRENLGDVILYGERHVESGRHVVLPFARMPNGAIEFFPTVDASLQYRFRKVIETCPSHALEDAVHRKMKSLIQDLLTQSRFVGVGSFEFVIEGTKFYLIEGLARLDTGFHLWERVAGTSALGWQLAALGHPAAQNLLTPRRVWGAGYAVRILCEDPVNELPQPGIISEYSEKRTWKFEQGEAEFFSDFPEEISPLAAHSLLGFGVAVGDDEKFAHGLAVAMVNELWISGSLKTNQRFISELLRHPWVRNGSFHGGFIDSEFVPSIRPEAEVLRILATVLSQLRPAERKFLLGDLWVQPGSLAIQWRAGPSFCNVESGKGVTGVVELSDGMKHRLYLYPLSAESWQARFGDWFLTLKSASFFAQPKVIGEKIFALVAGRVHSILYREGAEVAAHRPLLMIESLGTLVPHALPVDAKIGDWFSQAEDFVKAGQVLGSFVRG